MRCPFTLRLSYLGDPAYQQTGYTRRHPNEKHANFKAPLVGNCAHEDRRYADTDQDGNPIAIEVNLIIYAGSLHRCFRSL